MGQIRDLGRLVGIKSLRQSMEQFMNPTKIFLLSKKDMCNVHAYLLEHGMTQEKVPSARIIQWQHACQLISILYPGYPVARAREQAFKEDRLNRVPGAKTELAYDLLPTTDSLERLDQLIRLDIGTKTHTVSIPVQQLETYVKKKRKYKRNLRLHLYLWFAEWTILPPRCEALYVDSKNEWTKEDEKAIQRGFMHIDVTDKADWVTLFKKKKDSVAFEFKFKDDAPRFKFVSLCITWEKSPAELVSQLYTQSTTKIISRAMRSAEDGEKVQSEALKLLRQCPLEDRFDVSKTEKLFDGCVSAFSKSNTGKKRVAIEEDEEDELVMGDQQISVCDPIMLSRIQHPARSIYCTHVACFDALVFFKCEVGVRVWQCPQCAVQIRSIEELYIDYRLKQALATYPNEDCLIIRDGEYLARDTNGPSSTPVISVKAETKPPPHTICLEDDEDTPDRKRIRRYSEQNDT
ncbi:SUMO ligase siz1, partial [Apophysomyces sp. BC1034]